LAGEKQNELFSISRLIRQWHSLGLQGVDDDVTKMLETWRLKGDPKGVAVLTRDPCRGPLSDIEFEALHVELIRAYERGLIDIEDFTLTMLFVVTGRRPRQLGDLKAKDLRTVPGIGNKNERIIRIPRIKQRSEHWRSDFREFALEPNFAWMLEELLGKNEKKLSLLIPKFPKKCFDELPIFPDWQLISRDANQSVDGLIAAMRTIYFHRETRSIRKSVLDCTGRLLIPSERFSGAVRVFPLGLRRTLGVRAAREGYGDLIVAELLDHTDTQNVKIYTGSVPEHVDPINAAVALELAPMAQAFAGVIVESESVARRGEDASSRIRASKGAVAGNCGHYGFCGALAPIACYTCQFFQPWLDGPHEEILRDLQLENERIEKITGDATISTILNRTMLAVAEVVSLCRLKSSSVKV
jgi:integrase